MLNYKPILFSTEMVQALLKGRKTVTRRKIKLDLGMADTDKNDSTYLKIPDTDGDYHDAKDYCKYRVGDILYVRETWLKADDGIHYKADETPTSKELRIAYGYKWKPSIHMPKKIARIFLKVTDVRVERVKDITNKEAKREGIKVGTDNSGLMYKANFAKLWNSIYGDWNDNPFVWVIEFERVMPE